MDLTPVLPSTPFVNLDATCALAVLDASGQLSVQRPGQAMVHKQFCPSPDDVPVALLAAWRALNGDRLVDASGDAPRHVALAVPGSIHGDLVHLTVPGSAVAQSGSVQAWREALSAQTLLVVNDFTALAMAVPQLGAQALSAVGVGQAVPGAVQAVIGPSLSEGAGLGVSGVIPSADRRITLGSEGGHTTFAPADADELRLLQAAWQRWSHVSAERMVSAAGLSFVWSALDHQGQCLAMDEAASSDDVALPALQVVSQAHAGDARSLRAVQMWCRMLGTLAADVALTLGASGGVYLCGELLRQVGPLLASSGFRERFEAKGRLAPYLAKVPTWLVTEAPPLWQGLAMLLAEQVRVLPAGPSGKAASRLDAADAADATAQGPAPSALLARIQAHRVELSPAEQRVADHVLAHPRSVVNEPVSDIARMASVSQPTVIRFCRSLGFDGLSDFKLKLASHLSGAVPLAHSQVRVGDSAPDLSAKVLDNTVAAIVALRDGLNGQAVARAIDLLRQARRVEFHGVGNSHIVAVDAQYKFLRFGISATAHADSALQSMAADLLMPGDVVVAVSRSGAVPELLTAVSRALAAGASVVAITASDSPLARKATVTLAVDHVEGRTVQLSMVSRILHLLMIDVLAVGLAMQRPDAVRTPFGLRDDAAGLQPWVDWISHAR